MPPTPKAPGAEPSELETRVTALEDRLDQVVGTLERIAEIQFPSPEALDEFNVRLTALEDKPDPVVYADDQAASQRKPPAQKLCRECGAVEGTHFDDCATGRGEAAMPKTAIEREQVLAARGTVNRA